MEQRTCAKCGEMISFMWVIDWGVREEDLEHFHYGCLYPGALDETIEQPSNSRLPPKSGEKG